MERLNLDTVTYTVDGRHRVLGIFQDKCQVNTMLEYVIVWEHADTKSLQTARVDAYGRNFGNGIRLLPFSRGISLEEIINL